MRRRTGIPVRLAVDKGGGIGMWSEDCRFAGSRKYFVYDAKKNMFSFRSGGHLYGPSLRMFKIPPGQGPETVLRALKASGEITDDKDCTFVPVEDALAPPG